MTRTATHVVSAISGGALRPWHYASDPDQRQLVVDQLLGDEAGHVLFYVWDRPAGGDRDEYPAQQLKIVYRGGCGACHWSNGDPTAGPVGAWLAVADVPATCAPPLAYDPWDPDRVVMPAWALLPLSQLRELAGEYAATGHRPGARWQAVDFV